MLRLIIILLLCFYSLSASSAGIDIDKACEERNEQENALLSKMSTSITEAFLAGQCIGYEKTFYSTTSIDNLPQACAEYVERREALLPFDISTTLSEAAKAGMCMGVIYKVNERCGVDKQPIQYLVIAKGMKDMTESKAFDYLAIKLKCQ